MPTIVKGKEFKKIFNRLNISKEEGTSFEKSKDVGNETTPLENKKLTYEDTQGQYHTIYINYSTNIELFRDKGLNAYLFHLEESIINELKNVSTEFKTIIDEYFDNYEYHFLNECLYHLYSKTREMFIFIIDDWDYIFNHDLFFTITERYDYLSFLRNLLKNKSYVALAYRTGILPIANSPFIDFSMFKDHKYYKYLGFREEEVKKDL